MQANELTDEFTNPCWCNRRTLAYLDMYLVLAIAAGIMGLLAFVVRRNDPSGGHVVVE